MPGLPRRSAVIVIAQPILARVRGVLERNLIEQSAAERVVKAGFVAGLLWLAIWWALS